MTPRNAESKVHNTCTLGYLPGHQLAKVVRILRPTREGLATFFLAGLRPLPHFHVTAVAP